MEITLLLILSLGWLLLGTQYALPILLRTFVKSTLVVPNYEIKKRVTILLPCFNEGPTALHTIESICKSNYPHELLEIVIVDDHSTDDSWDWILKATKDLKIAKSNIKLQMFRQPINMGKYEALSKAASMATNAEIFICIDSDCIFDTEAITELVSSFVTDKIAAVGGHVRVSNVNDNLLSQAQTLVYFYAYNVMKMFQNYLKNVTCISGCLFAIRSSAFHLIAEDVKACNFLGAKFTAGEDRYMTHLLILNGYDTIVNLRAKCWTEVPTSYRKFFLQQWRWRRSGIQDYLLTLKTFSRHVKLLGPFTVLNLLLPETVNYILLTTMFFATSMGILIPWIIGHQIFALGVLIPFVTGIWLYMRKHAPDQLPTTHPLLLLPLISAWALTGTLLCCILAILTMDNGSWGTRISGKSIKT